MYEIYNVSTTDQHDNPYIFLWLPSANSFII